MSSHNQQEDGSFWVSYSDLAVGALMVFILIACVLLLDVQSKAQETEMARIEAEEAKEAAKELKEELESKKSDIEALVGVRQSLVAELSRQFAKQGQQVKIDPKTGALQLPSDIIFEQSSHTLSSEGKQWLEGFAAKYFDILMSEEFAKYVTRIEVEGHASSEGDEFVNLELSQSRALTVTKYILTGYATRIEPARRKRLKEVLVASGRGRYELVYNEKGEDRVASRRVVFKFRLTEEQTLKDIQEMMSSTQ